MCRNIRNRFHTHRQNVHKQDKILAHGNLPFTQNKFKKEDKINSNRVNQALNANKRMRLSKYLKRQRNLRK